MASAFPDPLVTVVPHNMTNELDDPSHSSAGALLTGSDLTLGVDSSTLMLLPDMTSM